MKQIRLIWCLSVLVYFTNLCLFILDVHAYAGMLSCRAL